MFKVSKATAVVGAVTLVAALVTISQASAASVAVSATKPTAAKPAAIKMGPTLTHTGKGPTGYEVTFRISAPAATTMLIKGEWSFASLDKIESNPNNNNPILPAQWQPGDFALQNPNSPGEGWPIASMTKDKTGVWSYTIPLPSGLWDYQFYADCAAPAPALKGCAITTDPVNPPWTGGSTSIPKYSEVYVPSDAKFGTDDLSYQADVPASQHGTLVDLAYASPTATNAAATQRVAVYTPKGYDPKRTAPYPVFVLFHGGGENELNWVNQGRITQTVDNLIAEGKMQPAVIVMPNVSSDVQQYMLPFIQANYNISSDPNSRALAGTSAFGGYTNQVLFGADPSLYGYYGPWSPASSAPAIVVTGQGAAPTSAGYQTAALKNVLGIDIAIGAQDLGGNAPQLTAVTERIGLQNAGLTNVSWYSPNGGHTWNVWRLALYDFLTKMAFKATSTTVAPVVSTTKIGVTATIASLSSGTAIPTGTVQFLVNGIPTGTPIKVVNGVATLTLTQAAAAKTLASTAKTAAIAVSLTVTAIYSGDKLYTTSTSS